MIGGSSSPTDSLTTPAARVSAASKLFLRIGFFLALVLGLGVLSGLDYYAYGVRLETLGPWNGTFWLDVLAAGCALVVAGRLIVLLALSGLRRFSKNEWPPIRFLTPLMLFAILAGMRIPFILGIVPAPVNLYRLGLVHGAARRIDAKAVREWARTYLIPPATESQPDVLVDDYYPVGEKDFPVNLPDHVVVSINRKTRTVRIMTVGHWSTNWCVFIGPDARDESPVAGRFADDAYIRPFERPD